MRLFNQLPIPSDRMGVIWSLSTIREACIVEYGPAGTTHYGIEGFMNLNADLAAKLFTTHISEEDLIMGSSDRLREALIEVDSLHKPQVIFVIASSLSAIVGTDLEGICKQLSSEVNAQLIPFTSGGFEGDYRLGVEKVLSILAEQLVEPPTTKQKAYNIIGSNADQYNFEADAEAIQQLMEGYFELSPLCVMTSDVSLSDLSKASEATINLVLRPEGILAAEHLKKCYGIPYVFGQPYGLKGTNEWVEAIGNVLGVEAQWLKFEKQRQKLKQAISHLRHSTMTLKPFTVSLVGDASLLEGMIPFLEKDLNMKVAGALLPYRTKESELEDLKKKTDCLEIHNYMSEKINFELLKSWNASILLADQMSLSLVPALITHQIANPNLSGHKLCTGTPHMAYQGALWILESLLNQIEISHRQLPSRIG